MYRKHVVHFSPYSSASPARSLLCPAGSGPEAGERCNGPARDPHPRFANAALTTSRLQCRPRFLQGEMRLKAVYGEAKDRQSKELPVEHDGEDLERVRWRDTRDHWVGGNVPGILDPALSNATQARARPSSNPRRLRDALVSYGRRVPPAQGQCESRRVTTAWVETDRQLNGRIIAHWTMGFLLCPVPTSSRPEW